MWLDELQRYLDGEHGLAGGVVRALLGAPGPVVLIGTLWPDRYAAYTAVPAPGGPDPHAREREVLDLAAVIRIGEEFSPAEQGRARAAAARDRRLAVALGAAGYGLTQTLAAAPQLVARWEDARAADPYGWAVLTAALDVARLGARAPLSADLLRAAAPGYCTSAQQAEAPANWFEQALAYATAKLHGAAAALAPAGAGMGQVAGYTVADYLLQHASRERRAARVPASTWDALLSHIRDPADAARLAGSAEGRLLYCYAIPLYRLAADAGDGYAAGGWPTCWPGAATWTGPCRSCAPADAGDGFAARGWPICWPSAGTWTSCGARGRRRRRGRRRAAGRPAGRARGPGRAARPGRRRRRVRRRAAGRAAGQAGGPGRAARPGRRRRRAAAEQLAELLAERGDLDGAQSARPGRRRRRVRRPAAGRAAGRARGPGRGRQILRARADAGDGDAAEQLADLLAERGDLDGAVQILRPRPTPATGLPPGGWPTCWPARGPGRGCAPGPTRATGTPPELADLLAERGDLDELRSPARRLADVGDAVHRWPSCWPSAGDLDGAADPRPGRRRRHDAARKLAGCWPSAGTWTSCAPAPTPATGSPPRRLAELLAERGDLDQAAQILRARADAGDTGAAELAAAS